MREDLDQILLDVRAAIGEHRPDNLAGVVADVHAADIAEIFTLLDDAERSELIFQLPARKAAEVVAELDDAERDEAFDDLDEQTLTEIVTELDPDDAADVLADLDEEERERILDQIPDEQAEQLEDLLTYDEDSAGGIMTPELVALPETATVAEAIERVRQLSEDEEIYYVYVVNDAGVLTGLVPLRQLVVKPKSARLIDVATRDPIAVVADEDQEVVAAKIRKYDVSAVPVVDEGGRLLGRVTHDDILDVAEEEADEDIFFMAGTEAAERDDVSTVRAASIRLRWLLPCLVGTAVSGTVMAVFAPQFPKSVYLTAVLFVPMMGAMGGNSGIQISTILVRALATGDLASTKVNFALAREVPISLIMAPVCGVAAALVTLVGMPVLQQTGMAGPDVHFGMMAIAVGIGMFAAILTASFVGMLLPFGFRHVGVDPAIASGPIVTTLNDIVSVSVYFIVCRFLLI